MNYEDGIPNNFYEAPGCDVIICSPGEKTISAKKAAAILMRLHPDAKVQFWVKIVD